MKGSHPQRLRGLSPEHHSEPRKGFGVIAVMSRSWLKKIIPQFFTASFFCVAFLKLCGEIQWQGKTRIGLLITALRRSSELLSAVSHKVLNLQLPPAYSDSWAVWVLLVGFLLFFFFKKIVIWFKFTFFHVIFVVILILLQFKPENAGKEASTHPITYWLIIYWLFFYHQLSIIYQSIDNPSIN